MNSMDARDKRYRATVSFVILLYRFKIIENTSLNQQFTNWNKALIKLYYRERTNERPL